MTIRLKEAIEFAKQTRSIKTLDLAKILWKGRNSHTAATNIGNLSAGRTKTISIDSVPIICKELGVTADFLFGLSDQPTKELEYRDQKKKLQEVVDLMSDMVDDAREILETL